MGSSIRRVEEEGTGEITRTEEPTIPDVSGRIRNMDGQKIGGNLRQERGSDA